MTLKVDLQPDLSLSFAMGDTTEKKPPSFLFVDGVLNFGHPGEATYQELATTLWHNHFSESSGNIFIFQAVVPDKPEPFQRTLDWLKSLERTLKIGLSTFASKGKNWLKLAWETKLIHTAYDALRLCVENRHVDLPNNLPFTWEISGKTYKGSLQMHTSIGGYRLKLNIVGPTKNEWPVVKRDFITLLLGPSPVDGFLESLETSYPAALPASRLEPLEERFQARRFAATAADYLSNQSMQQLQTKPDYKTLLSMVQKKQPLRLLIAKYYGTTTWSEDIKNWRLHQSGGLSCAQCAALWGISEKTLRGIESGQSRYWPLAQTLHQIATSMGIDPSILLYKVNRSRNPQIEDHWTRTHEEEIYVDTEWLADLLKDLQRNIGFQYQGNLRYAVLKAHLTKYKKLYVRDKYEGYWGDTLYNFLTLKLTPSPELLPILSVLTGKPLGDFHDFVIDHHFPPTFRRQLNELQANADFNAWMQKQGLTRLRFPIDSRDKERINHYIKHPDSFGFKIWVIRKMLGLDFTTAANVWHMTHTLNPVEMDQANGLLNAKLKADLAIAIDIPLPVLEQWIKDCYSDQEIPKETNPIRFQAKEGSLKEMMLAAMGGIATYDQVIQRCREAMARIEPAFATISWPVLEHLLVSGKNRTAKVTPESVQRHTSDIHLAAIILAFAESINVARFWALTRPDLREIFPTLKGHKPYIELPKGTKWHHIWETSLAAQITGWRVGAYSEFPVDKATLTSKLELSGVNFVSLHEAKDYAFYLPTLKHMAPSLGLDIRLVYLARHPWVLLGMPLKDPQGQALSLFETPLHIGMSRKNKIEIIAHEILRGLGLLNDARLIVLKVLRKMGVSDNEEEMQKQLGQMGFSDKLSKRMIHTERILTDEELLFIAKHPNFIEVKLKLLEGSRKGILLFFMGLTKDSNIDWTWPEGWDETRLKLLDLLSVAQQIAQTSGKSFRSFWDKQPGFNARSLKEFEARIQKGFTDEDIYQFSKLAQGAGFPELTPKVLFLYFKYDFLKNFVDLQSDQTSHSEITETIEPDPIDLEQEIQISQTPDSTELAGEIPPEPVLFTSTGIAGVNLNTNLPFITNH